MSQYKYDYLVFIGRFQPFHVGHLQVIETALKMSKKVIVLVGSSNQPRTEKNPFTFDERRLMILHSLEDVNEADNFRVEVMPLHDQKYNDQKWATSVQQLVDKAMRLDIVHNDLASTPSHPKIGMIGHTKDESSYYLKMFPQWEVVEHGMNDQINATDLRRILFEGQSLKFLEGVVPAAAMAHIGQFVKSAEYDIVRGEYAMIKKYKKSWEVAPYAPTFVTTDAVIIQSGHVLLIERGAAPGLGLDAFPGGFLEQNKTILQNLTKELREETRIKVPEPVLVGNIKMWKVFDRPDRSSRGRTVTHAALIVLPDGPLPIVKGGDDAAKARWVPIQEVLESKMFEDHWHILQFFLGQI